MSLQPLSRLPDWQLEHSSQDVRGRPVTGEGGQRIGTVDDMIVDTDAQRVVALRLDSGREIAWRELEIRDGNTLLRTAGTTTTEARGERTMPLREEELVVRKREVPVGQVEIEKDVVTERRTMDVPVSRDEVVVERHPVNRQPADRPIGEGGERVRVPVNREEVTTEKRPVVTEEVTVGTQRVSETAHVEDTVRKEVADVDTEGEVRRADERR